MHTSKLSAKIQHITSKNSSFESLAYQCLDNLLLVFTLLELLTNCCLKFEAFMKLFLCSKFLGQYALAYLIMYRQSACPRSERLLQITWSTRLNDTLTISSDQALVCGIDHVF